MKIASIIFSVLTLISGGICAWLWWEASKGEIGPTWAEGDTPFEPVEPSQASMGWILGILNASREAARLNKLAAIWSGLTALLSGIATLLGALPG